MDMAVGIIIGGAFTSIVTSLVNDIINPILGVFGGMNFDQLSVKLFGEATLYYGKFLTAVVNFLIMALIVFCIVKAMNAAGERFGRKEEKNLTQRSVHTARARLPLRQQDARIVHQCSIQQMKVKIAIHLLHETNKIHCIKCENLLHTV